MTNTTLPLFALETPSMPVLDVTRCYAKPINYLTASTMVKEFHYAHRVPMIMESIGMYIDHVLAGVVTYGMPASRNVLLVCGETYVAKTLELNRLFIHEWAGRNSESWLIAQSFKWLEKRFPHIKVLVSYADTGENHLGRIYQATNWLYTGVSVPPGTHSKVTIDEGQFTSKTFFDRYGSQSKETVLAYHPEAVFETKTNKHRYVMFLGDKREKKQARAALKYPVLPYPKEANNI